jgi:carbon-monoxide dehydrogenase medium subunit
MLKFKQPASRFALVGVFVAQSAGRRARGGDGCGALRVPRHRARGGARTRASRRRPRARSSSSADGMNGDLHASAEYRAAMVSVMAARAVEAALAT